METELKLLLSPSDLPRVARAKAFSAARRGPARSARFLAVYFDTPDRDLMRKGMALRLRKEGRAWKQTVKRARMRLGGLAERDEFEWSVAGESLELELLKSSPLGRFFSKRKIAQRLRPVFRMDFRRRTVPLHFDDDSSALLALDLGTIRAGRRSEPICEAEIELSGGTPLAMLDAAGALLEEFSCRMGHRSKAERANALLGGARAVPQKWHRPEFEPDLPASLACLSLFDACATQLHANEDGFLGGGDPEFLHHMRTGMRRLRVALSMPRDPEWRARLGAVASELKWASGILGAARNWDVFASELVPPLARACGAHSLSALRRRVARNRREAVQAARQAVRSPRYQKLGLALARLGMITASTVALGMPAQEFGDRAMSRRYRKLLAWSNPASLDADELHRMRIATKKMRYVAEFFGSLYPQRKLKRFTGQLESLQALLGTVNDAQVSARMVEHSARQAPILDREAVGLAKGWIAAQEAFARERLPAAWEAFRSLETYWK